MAGALTWGCGNVQQRHRRGEARGSICSALCLRDACFERLRMPLSGSTRRRDVVNAGNWLAKPTSFHGRAFAMRGAVFLVQSGNWRILTGKGSALPVSRKSSFCAPPQGPKVAGAARKGDVSVAERALDRSVTLRNHILPHRGGNAQHGTPFAISICLPLIVAVAVVQISDRNWAPPLCPPRPAHCRRPSGRIEHIGCGTGVQDAGCGIAAEDRPEQDCALPQHSPRYRFGVLRRREAHQIAQLEPLVSGQLVNAIKDTPNAVAEPVR